MKLEKWKFYEAGWRTAFYPVCVKGQARVVSMAMTLVFIMKIISIFHVALYSQSEKRVLVFSFCRQPTEDLGLGGFRALFLSHFIFIKVCTAPDILMSIPYIQLKYI